DMDLGMHPLKPGHHVLELFGRITAKGIPAFDDGLAVGGGVAIVAADRGYHRQQECDRRQFQWPHEHSTVFDPPNVHREATLGASDPPNNTEAVLGAGPLLSRSFCYLCHPIQEEFLSACTWRCLMGSGKFVLSSVFALAIGLAPLGV